MRPRFYGGGRIQRMAALVVLAVFVAAGVYHYWSETGDDLASSYIGCRLVANGQADHLYARDPNNFSQIGVDDPWQDAADQGGFDGSLHPYVQTPLWAYALRPLCRGRFTTFDRTFTVLMMLSLAGAMWLTALHWAPSLLNPYAMAAFSAGLWFSEPFRYAMYLMQTHALFFLITIAALVLAERHRPIAAGALLACAAAVKITPGFLLVYWLCTRKWKGAVSMLVWSAVLWVATVAIAGRTLTAAYLADMHWLSRLLLVTYNNESFAAALMGHWYHTHKELFEFVPLVLPPALRIGCTLLVIASVVAGGIIDRRQGERFGVGAMIGLMACTLFAPIAWTHYFIILIAPAMVLLERNRWLRSWWIWGLLALMAALNYQPIAVDAVNEQLRQYTLMRSEFYAGVLCLAAAGIAAFKASRARITAARGSATMLEEAQAA